MQLELGWGAYRSASERKAFGTAAGSRGKSEVVMLEYHIIH
jgi:hypothetical protein